MNEHKVFNDLVIWLEKSGNSRVSLASRLGYKSSNAIQMWLKRGYIPERQLQSVANIIKSKGVRR